MSRLHDRPPPTRPVAFSRASARQMPSGSGSTTSGYSAPHSQRKTEGGRSRSIVRPMLWPQRTHTNRTLIIAPHPRALSADAAGRGAAALLPNQGMARAKRMPSENMRLAGSWSLCGDDKRLLSVWGRPAPAWPAPRLTISTQKPVSPSSFSRHPGHWLQPPFSLTAPPPKFRVVSSRLILPLKGGTEQSGDSPIALDHFPTTGKWAGAPDLTARAR